MSDIVIVGLSGGVDSCLSALLLKEQGYQVIGISMSIYNKDIPNLLSGNACYGPAEKPEITNIHEFGKRIGIQTYVFDCSVKCNELMKFGLLIEKAKKEGIQFDKFATGHYCQTGFKNGRYLLKKGVDEKKDQSYFLYRLNQKQLSEVLLQGRKAIRTHHRPSIGMSGTA